MSIDASCFHSKPAAALIYWTAEWLELQIDSSPASCLSSRGGTSSHCLPGKPLGKHTWHFRVEHGGESTKLYIGDLEVKFTRKWIWDLSLIWEDDKISIYSFLGHAQLCISLWGGLVYNSIHNLYKADQLTKGRGWGSRGTPVRAYLLPTATRHDQVGCCSSAQGLHSCWCLH